MIRIPRKKKKAYRYSPKMFPYIPKVERYYAYFSIKDGMKRHNLGAEELCNKYGRYVMDEVIWWAWVRWKELGIQPELSTKYRKYWNYFVDEGVITFKI